MKDPVPNNNEFEAAERALRKITSNLWFSGLSDEWREFLVANTVEHFDTYQVTMQQAAIDLISVYQKLVNKNPDLLKQNPWQASILDEQRF